MLKIISTYLFLVCVVLCCTVVYGQGERYMATSSDSVEIGTTIDVTYDLRFPADAELVSIDISTLDSTINQLYGVGNIYTDKHLDWSVLPGGAVRIVDKQVNISDLSIGRVNNQQIVKWTTPVTVYSTGIFKLSYPKVVTRPSVSWQAAAPAQIVVLPPDDAGQTLSMAPIRDIVEESASWQDYWIVLLVGVIILLSLLLWYIIDRRSKDMDAADIEYPEQEALPAHEVAIAALADLDRKQLWQQGEIKSYQSELTDIMRAYLSARYDIPAQEQTTREIKASLKSLDLHPRHIDKILEVLQVADLVKFAKARPDLSVHQQFLEDARQIVLDTADKLDVA